MFPGFARVWTPVEFSSGVSRRPRRVRVAGETIVLFRDRQGRVGALLDRCPHRGASLALGRVTEDGHLQCAYHGWCFATDGERTAVPFNPPETTSRKPGRAVSFPARESAGLVWIYTSANDVPPELPIPESVSSLPPRGKASWIFRAHWTRIVENLMDSAHLPFVHRNTLYRLRAAVFPANVELKGCLLHLRSEETETGFSARARVTGPDGLDHPNDNWFEWNRPNHIAFHNTLPGLPNRPKPFIFHLWMVPRDAATTRVFTTISCDTARFNLLPPLVMAIHRYSFGVEDRRTIESEQPPEVPPPAEEAHVATDVLPLTFRRYYFNELRDSSAEGGARVALHARGRRPSGPALSVQPVR